MEYLEVEQARQMPGLRLVLTRGFLNPWGETAKALFRIKGIPFIPVSQYAAEPNLALKEWTGQTAAPAAIYDDEPPRLSWGPLLHLAQRLEPDPPLLPAQPDQRIRVLGLCEELAGEDGLGWNRRLNMMAHWKTGAESPFPEKNGERVFLKYASRRGQEVADRANSRVMEILAVMGQLVEEKERAGHRYLVCDQLTVLDVMWAAFCNILDPLPPQICDLPDELREMYTATEAHLRVALTPAMLNHRDFMYTHHMEPPTNL